MQLTIIAAIFFAIIGVFFAMQNNVPVTVTFLLWRFDSALAMVLLLSLAIGAIIVALITTPVTLRRQWQLKRQKQRIEELERNAGIQAQRIAELEREAPKVSPDTAPERSYVGLKQIIAGDNEN